MQDQPVPNRVPDFSLKFDELVEFDLVAENNPRATVKQWAPLTGERKPDCTFVVDKAFEFTDQVSPRSSLNGTPENKPASQSDPAA
jgi:hypothetical protein